MKLSQILLNCGFIKVIKMWFKDFPSGPVVKILCFHCRNHEFDPWPGKQACCPGQPEAKRGSKQTESEL